MRRHTYYILSLIVIIGILSGCGSQPSEGVPTVHLVVPTRQNTATATQTATLTHTATETSTHTATSTSVPTETETSVPETNTPTLTNTVTPTPQPTEAPTLEPTVTQPVTEFFNYMTGYDPIPLNRIEKDQLITGQITNQQPASAYIFTAQAGDIIDIDFASTSGDLDAVLLVLTAKGQEIARNNDTGIAASDLTIQGLELVDAGDYVIIATRFYGQFGFSEGMFELNLTPSNFTTLTEGILTTPIRYAAPAKGVIDDENPIAYYSFRANEGDVINIEMQQASNNLDPNLMLLNNQATILFSNDDNPIDRSINSLINDFVIPVSGYYTILATRFFDSETQSFGSFELELNIVATNTNNEYPIDAVLDMQNSRTVRADGQFYTTHVVGDVIDFDGIEQRLQILLTFTLPPNISAADVNNVTFETGFCSLQGGGFTQLGDMTVYQDNYGQLNLQRDFTRTTTGARIITTARDCAPIDLTNIVTSALEADQREIQLRFVFRDSPANGQTDQIYFTTPRLLLRLSE